MALTLTPKSSSNRRRDVRRQGPTLADKVRRFFAQPGVGWATVYVIVYAVASMVMAVPAREHQGFRNGQLALAPVVSRQDIRQQNLNATRQAQDAAAMAVSVPLKRNAEFLQSLNTRLMSVQSFIDDENVESIPVASRQGLELTQEALDELHVYRQVQDPIRAWVESTNQLVHKLRNLPIVSDADAETLARRGWVLSPSETPASASDPTPDPIRDTLYRLGADQAALNSKVQELVQQSFGPGPALKKMLSQVVLNQMQPVFVIDHPAYEASQAAAKQGAEAVYETIEAGTTLIEAGQALSVRDIELLALEREAFLQNQPAWWMPIRRAGVGLLCLVTALGLWTYMYQYKRRVVANPTRGFAVLAMLLLTQFIAIQTSMTDQSWLWLTATFPTLLAAMIFAVVYDQRTALAIGLMHTLMVVFALKLPVSVGLVTMTGVGSAVCLLPDVRSRSQMLRVGLVSGTVLAIAAMAAMVAAWPVYLPSVQPLLKSGALAGLASGLIAGMVVHSLISLDFLERVFSVTTALTLKDLNDAGHPLLQRLAQEAPGTYQHSLRIADMAEAAAEAIGGNALLCRVGAMYHDIGKVNKPQYFIENQGGGPNKHDKLSPAMSLLIIIGHVKDGLEMAREHKLPTPIRHMIESHHGTTLVEYFYHAAKTQAEAQAQNQGQPNAQQQDGPALHAAAQPAPTKPQTKPAAVDEFHFRYPGPKPQTKEAGILLLCDSMEAAARAMDDPTPVRLEQLVKAISKKRLMDGQFDDCSLTLKELARIEASVTKTLCAAYHGRIKYPGGEKKDGKKDNKANQGSQAGNQPPQAPALAQPAAS